MSKKSAPIVFLNFEDTETDFNVVNNAEEAADDNYYKFVESEYDKLQMVRENVSEDVIAPKVIVSEPVVKVKKKRGPKPKPKLEGDQKAKKKQNVDVGDVESSSVSTITDKPKKRGRKSTKGKELLKSSRKKRKKREKKTYHFCDDDDDGDIGLEGAISDDEYIRRLEEQVHKEEILQAKEAQDSNGEDDESSSREQDSLEGMANDNDGMSTLEDQFTVCDEDILSCKSECSESNEAFVQTGFTSINVHPDFENDGSQDIPELELPPSSNDLRCPLDNLMDCCGIYEVLRRYGRLLRLSPFRLEDFIAAINARENSILLAEIHICLLKAALREDDASATWISLQDQKDSVNISFYLADVMCWPQLLREYVNSITLENDPSSALSSLEMCSRYPYVDFRTRLRVLQTLTDNFLASSAVREEIIRENVIRYEDYCRICHKMGDLLCCDLCPAVFHLDCLDPPISQVPRDEWHCPVCTQQRVAGVTDCVSQGERRGILHRHAPLGKDRHGRQYWFIARRLFVESPAMDSDGCVLSNGNSSLWYYSSYDRFIQILNSLSDEYEQALIETLKENQTEIQRQMLLTKRLTIEKWQKHRENLNLSPPELLSEIAACEQLRLETGANPSDPTQQDGQSDNMNDNINAQDPNALVVDQETGEKFTMVNENGSGNGGYVTRTRTGSLIQSYRDSDYLVDSRGNIPTNEEELRDMIKKQEAENTKKPGVYEIDDRVYIYHTDGYRFQLRKTRSGHTEKNGFDKTLTGGFRLSDDGEWRKWVNIHSSNQQEASSKQQFQEERDKKRFLSYKFSLTPASEMEWIGDTHGSTSALMNCLRLTISQLETRIPSAFLVPRWKEIRKSWYVGLHRCGNPRQLLTHLAKLEASIKPMCFVNAWHDAVGHLSLERITSAFREEKKKAKQIERKSAKLKSQEQNQTLNDLDDENGDDEEPVQTETVYTKNPGQIKHRVWKIPGEEYRVTAGDGWLWCSKGWKAQNRKPDARNLSTIAVNRRRDLLEKVDINPRDAPIGWGVLGDNECGSIVSHENRGSRFVLKDVHVLDLGSDFSETNRRYFPNLSEQKAPSKLDSLLAFREAQESLVNRSDDESVLADTKENSDTKVSIEEGEKSELEFLRKKLGDLTTTKEQLELLWSQETSRLVKETIAPPRLPRRGNRAGVKRGPYRKRKSTLLPEAFTPVEMVTPRHMPYKTTSVFGKSMSSKRTSYYTHNESDNDLDVSESTQKDEDYKPSSDEDGEDFLLPQVDGVADSGKQEIGVVRGLTSETQPHASLQTQATNTVRPSMLMVKTAGGQLVSVQMRQSIANATSTTTGTNSGLRILRVPGAVSNTTIASTPKQANPRPVTTAVSGSLVVKKVAGRPSASDTSEPSKLESANVPVTPIMTTKQPISLPTSGVQTIKVVPGSLNTLPSQLGNMRIVVRPSAGASNNPGASLIKTSPPTASPQVSTVRPVSINTSSITTQSGGHKVSVPITTLTVDQIRALQQRRLQDHKVDLDSDDEVSENRVSGVRQKVLSSQASLSHAKPRLSTPITSAKPKSTIGTRPILPATSSVSNTVIKQISSSGQSQKPASQFIRISVLPTSRSDSTSGRQIVASAVNSNGQPILFQQLSTASGSQLQTISSATAGGRRSLAKQQHSSMTPIPIPVPTVVTKSSLQSRFQTSQRRQDDISTAGNMSLPGLTFSESLQIRIYRLQVELHNVKNKIKELEDNFVARNRTTADRVSIQLSKHAYGNRKTLNNLLMPSSKTIPKVTDFLSSNSDLKNKASANHNLFRLDSDKLRTLIVKAGRVELQGFHYEKKTSYLRWPYPGPRPSLSYGWRYRLQTSDSLFGVALQLRIMWHCLKWDDITCDVEKYGICKEENKDGLSYRRLLDTRYADAYGLKCEVKIESHIFRQSNQTTSKVKARSLDSDEEAQEEAASDSDPDFRPGISSGRRRRKRRPPKRNYNEEDDDQPNSQEPTVSISWIPDTKVDLWELKHHAQTLQKLISASRVSSESMLMKSQILPTPVSSEPRPVSSQPMTSGTSVPKQFELSLSRGKRFAIVNSDMMKNKIKIDNKFYEVVKDIPASANLSGNFSSTPSRPKRSNAGMKMRQWQDDSEVADLLAAYDEEAKPQPQERPIQEISMRPNILPRRPPSHLMPWNRQVDRSAASRPRPRSGIQRRKLDDTIEEEKAHLARQRAERQLHARIRKQIFKRTKELRVLMQERRKLLHSELKLQIEEEVTNLKQQQMNEMLERKRNSKERKLKKQMKQEMKKRLKKETGDTSFSSLTPKPPGKKRGRKPKYLKQESPDLVDVKVEKHSRKRRASEMDEGNTSWIDNALKPKRSYIKKQIKTKPRDISPPARSPSAGSVQKSPTVKKQIRAVKKEVKTEPVSPSFSIEPPKPEVVRRGPGRPKKNTEIPTTPTVPKKRGRKKREELATPIKEEPEVKMESNEEMFCICKTPYDPAKFYIGCDLCEGWFHGECVNMSPKSARKVASWICPECQTKQDEMQEELYCICRQPYDEKKFYVACDSCNDWFHGVCVGLSEEEAADIDSYICPKCIDVHKNKRGRVKTLYDHRINGATKSSLLSLLEEMKNNPMSWPFLEPIDIKEEPNYTRIVPNPMDMKTVETQLRSGKYKDVGHFVADMHLIFSNCRRYNPKDTPHFRCADVLETLFVKRMKSIYSEKL